jgi:NAD(P)-dependent dehydrogenase (short-subunit alcohol dehydrogenase family)
MNNVYKKLQGKQALITGSGTGIGRELALEFARQGADVVLHYAHSQAGAESAVAEITAAFTNNITMYQSVAVSTGATHALDIAAKRTLMHDTAKIVRRDNTFTAIVWVIWVSVGREFCIGTT